MRTLLRTIISTSAMTELSRFRLMTKNSLKHLPLKETDPIIRCIARPFTTGLGAKDIFERYRTSQYTIVVTNGNVTTAV